MVLLQHKTREVQQCYEVKRPSWACVSDWSCTKN